MCFKVLPPPWREWSLFPQNVGIMCLNRPRLLITPIISSDPTFPTMPFAEAQTVKNQSWWKDELSSFLCRLSVRTRSVSGPLVAAEEAHGSRLWAGFSESHDGCSEAAGSGSESGRGWRRRFPLCTDPGATTAAGGASSPQQHNGKSHGRKYIVSNLIYVMLVI